MPSDSTSPAGSAATDSRGEVAAGERFAFGANWSAFLSRVERKHVEQAKESLGRFLGLESLTGKKFLDVGSGSGLFSLAASELGATVHSFDYDLDSVACTRLVQRRFAANATNWTIEQGSILDDTYVAALGQFDIVYSWGVLHHTGAMWRACENAGRLVAPGGLLFIALYNDQGWPSRVWYAVKRAYNALPGPLRFLVLWPAALRLWGPTHIRDLLRGRPLATWREYPDRQRGMHPWRDVIDWVGGFPFEVATPQQVTDFYGRRGWEPLRVTGCGRGHGCNEFLLRRKVQGGERFGR